ncbi:MAG: zinc-dependent metalloprotease [Balneolaceae bacterium]
MRLISIIFFSLLLIVPFESEAQRNKSADNNNKEQNNTNQFDKLIKDALHIEGFFDLYHKDDKLYLAIEQDMLDSDFLMSFQIARGVGSAGLYGGTMLSIFEPNIVALQKHEGKIFLVNKPHRYKAEEGTPQNLALKNTYGESVLETAKIEATSEDSVMLINAYDWFVGDLSNISERVAFAVASRPGQPGRVSFDKSRSHLESVKSFPENTNVTARLTFKNNEQNAPRPVPDSRFIPISLHYTLAKLPDQPMKPRYADDRLGYFMTVHKDFTEENKTFFKRYINRWRLECDGPPAGDGLCDPVQPIVYHIDHTVPERYRKPMMEGVEAWADAFEAAGFRNAVQAKMLPEGVDAEDIRYATLRWNVSDQPGYSAIGPSIVDPRTGEILDADMLFEANMIMGFKSTYRNMVDPRTAIDEIYNVSEAELEHMQKGFKTASFYNELGAQGNLIRGFLMSQGVIGAADPVPDYYLDEAVRWVTMHEVGHTLGLRHNFRSSVDTPLDKLYDEDWAKKNGIFSSVMDYPAPNISPDTENTGHFYNPGVGSYDRWVISFGYTPDDERAGEIARLAAQPGHAYGTDEDARGAGAVDPTINVFDLGDDPLAWGRERAELIREMIPKLPDIALEDNMPFYELTDLFQNMFFQYARAMGPTIKYIGGQYQYRDRVGDPNGRAPFEPVEREKQVEALNMIVDYLYAYNAFELPQDVFQQFGANRWSHWGHSNTYSGRIDYPLHETLLGIQASVLSQLLNGTRLSRIRDTEVKFGTENTVTIPELMNKLSNAVWSEVWNPPGQNISGNRRDLQRTHLDEMIKIVTDAPSNMPADARSIARMQLQDLHDRLERRLTPPTADFVDYTRAHLFESRERIKSALKAGFSLEN